MTTEQFTLMLNSNYGLAQDFPKELKVDAETYANACQKVFEQEVERQKYYFNPEGMTRISLGKHNGIMFKGIELILKT